MIPNQKDLFSIPAGVNFLNCANMAPQLNAITDAGLESVRQKNTPWKIQSDDWFTNAERLRALAAQLCNASPEDMALIPATSYGIAIAAQNVPVQAGQNIVLLAQEYPSNVYAWWELAQAHALSITTVEKGENGWTETILAAINSRTAVVSVPNCHWTDGSLIDLVQIGEKVRQVGACLIVDASQSLGAYPIDVKAVQPDFMVIVGYKWLIGPYAAGYFYVAPRWQQGKPIENSWLNRKGSEDFARLVDYQPAYKAGARRYDTGEFPNFVLLPMAVAALEQILHWRIAEIQATLGQLTQRLADSAASMGYQVTTADQRVSHMVGIRSPQPFSPTLKDRLTRENVFVGFRGDSIRVAPYLYNSPEDIDQLLRILQETKNL